MSASAWTPAQPIISLRDVHKSFGPVEVLKGITFDVMKGEVVCVIGPSGSGKSTLIRCINALNDIQKGSILVEGQEVNDPKLDKLALGARRRAGSAALTAAKAERRLRSRQSSQAGMERRSALPTVGRPAACRTSIGSRAWSTVPRPGIS